MGQQARFHSGELSAIRTMNCEHPGPWLMRDGGGAEGFPDKLDSEQNPKGLVACM